MKKLVAIAAVVLSVAFIAPAAVMAHGVEAEDSTTTTTTTTSTETETETEVETHVKAVKEAAKARAKTSKDRAAEVKAAAQANKAELKMDICEKRTKQLQQVLPKTQNGAKSVKTAIDKSYERVQAFYVAKGLSAANYDALIATVEEAKTNAEAALTVVDSYDFKVDCTSQTIAGQLDEYRTAVKDARADLKTYRASVVDLIKGIKTSAQAKTDEGDTAQ